MDQFLTLEMGLLFWVFLFFEKSSSFCRENEIYKNKKNKKKQKLGPVLTLEKAKIGPVFNSTAHIYIYAVRLAQGPSLSF